MWFNKLFPLRKVISLNAMAVVGGKNIMLLAQQISPKFFKASVVEQRKSDSF